MNGLLVIIPCGQRKIWEKEPGRGPTQARDAYIGTPFKVNKLYAEKFAEQWLILSAKYGFIRPSFPISGPYEVTFKDPTTNPVSIATLRTQRLEEGLQRFEIVVGLGGKEYRHIVVEAFEPAQKVRFPFAGLPVGKAMQATKRAVEMNDPFAATKGEASALLETTRPSLSASERMMDEQPRNGKTPPTRRDFQAELDRIFSDASQRGLFAVEVKSGDLHRRLGGYPAGNHRMPTCCGVMRRNMQSGDQVLEEPPGGKGATLLIRYKLPR